MNLETMARVERDISRNLALMVQFTVPQEHHHPLTKIQLRARWPRAQGRLEAPEFVGALGQVSRSASESLSGRISAQLFSVSSARVRSVSQGHSEYVREAERIVEFGGFVSDISLKAATYELKFPVAEPAGTATGAHVDWRFPGQNKWEPVPVMNDSSWKAEISQKLPCSLSRFVGHKDLRLQLTEELLGSGGNHLVLIHGPGGIGKTALARAVLEDIKDPRWTAVLGFTAKGKRFDIFEGKITETSESVVDTSRKMYNSLVDYFSIKWDGIELETAHRLVREKIQEHRNTLFIIDNLETVDESGQVLALATKLIDPPPRGFILATTREIPPGWDAEPNVRIIDIGRLPNEDIDMIIREMLLLGAEHPGRYVDEADIKRMVVAADGHPLTAKFIAHVYRHPKNWETAVSKASGEVLDYCFEAQWPSLNHSQQMLLHRIAGLEPGPKSVPDITTTYSEQLGERGVNDALRRLWRLSFVEISHGAEESYVTLHSRVRQWLNSQAQ